MKKYFKTYQLLFLVLLPILLFSQEYQVEVQHLSVQEGLSSRWVNSITQSPDGYIWIATKHGLNRYDGQNFKHFTSNSHQLQNDKIKRIHATADNLLWLFYGEVFHDLELLKTFKVTGIDILNLKNETVVPFEDFFEEPVVSLKELAGTYLDEDARLWFWTRKGTVFRYDGKMNKIYSLKKEGKINCLTKGNANDFYLVNNKNILHINEAGELVSKDTVPSYAEYLYQDKENTLWLSVQSFNQNKQTGNPLLYHKKEGAESKQFIPAYEEKKLLNNDAGNYFNWAVLDKQERTWFHENGILELTDPSENWSHNFKARLNDLSDIDRVMCSYFDQNNTAFFGSDNGFFIINVEPYKIQSVFRNIPGNISARAIIDFSPDSLLICTYGNTYFVHKKTGAVEPIPMLKGGSHYGGIKDSKGRIWMGMHSSKIRLVNFDLNTTTDFYLKTLKDFYRAALKPYEDKNTKRIWVGLNKGLAYLNEAAAALELFDPGEKFPEFGDHRVQCFYQNKEGMWIGTTNGLYLYKEGKGLVKKYMHFPNLNINYIYEDKEGVFWLSTLGGGLLRWDKNKEEVLQITTREGLSNNFIYAAIEDDQKRLWMPSNAGLMCFDKKDFSTKTYYPNDGLPHKEFNNTSYCRTREGMFYLGGIKGVIGFDPENLDSIKSNTANLVITKFEKNDPKTGRLVNALDDLKNTGIITINPDENAFELHLAMLHFHGSRQIKYRYKIDEIDSDWYYTDENIIRINRLPFGEYTLRLNGQGSGGSSTSELQIPINVIRPFYRKIWFYLLLFFTLSGLIFNFVRWRLRFLKNEKEVLELEVQKRTEQINEQNQKLEALNDTKDQFFGILAHDLRGPMLSFRGLSEKFQYLIKHKKTERIEELSTSIETAFGKLEGLLDNLLKWAMMQKGTLPYNPQTINLYDLVEEVIDLYEEMAKNKEITLHNEVAADFMIFADPNALSSIFRNIINNAIKFSGKETTISVFSNIENGETLCIVKDQGYGISEEDIDLLFDFNPRKKRKNSNGAAKKKGTGLGLQLCKELIRLHNGKIKVESELGKGTLVSMTFPLQKIILEK